MEVLHPTALLAEPNKCILCDETPHPSEQRVIDTGQTMIAPFSDNVWTKYVCEKCGLAIANRLGFVSNEQARVAFHAAEVAAERLRVVRDKIASASEDIHSYVTDVSLGNERASLGKILEGEYVEPKATTSEKKPVGRPRKAAPVSVGSTTE